MPIGIDELELDIADREASNIRSGAERQSKVGEMVSGNIEPALGAVEDVAKLNESKRMKGEWAKLTAQGEQSIDQLAQELGIEDASQYVKMFQAQRNPQTGQTDPKVMLNVMELMKKQQTQQAKQGELDAFATKFQGMEGIEDPAKFEEKKNELNQYLSTVKDKDVFDRISKQIKLLDENQAAKTVSRAAKGKRASNAITTLRKDFGKESKNLDEILRNTGVLRNAYQQGEYRDKEGKVNRVASDQALIMTFNKILDPTSVVRESEFNRTPEAAGAMNRAVGWFDKLLEGGSGLTTEGRAAVYKMSEIIAKGALVDKFIKIKEYEGIAGIDAIDPAQIKYIFPGFEAIEGDYAEFKSMSGDDYINKLVAELNESLNQAEKGVIPNKHKKIKRKGSSYSSGKGSASKDAPKKERRKATAEDF